MDFFNKIHQLKEIININILPLMKKECVLFDLPYYFNIGDTLIWEGTESFFQENNIKCIRQSSCKTYIHNRISKDVAIVLQGGGNFGDLWNIHQIFRKKIITDYKSNRIVVFPQTIFYENIDNAISDAKVFATHEDLTICARDKRSYEFLNTYFSKNNIILVPDMAFYICTDKLNKYRVDSRRKTLYLKRNDKELGRSDFYEKHIPPNSDILDWPTINKSTLNTSLFSIISKIGDNIPNSLFYTIIDSYAKYILKPHLIKKGVTFVSSYDEIYTTRLHVAILCILLNKPFNFFDNSYGKNKGFYDTWLSDLESIRFISEDA